ncbi:MAG: deoxyribodipyrimidine photo-lyase [Candidatus Methylomirabilota bacterium]
MASSEIAATRIRPLNDRGPARGSYVLYWMQQSQRAEMNHALEYAVRRANALGQPLLAAFGLMDGYPEASLRHYRFMLEGLAETEQTLRRRGIRLAVRRGDPDAVTLALSRDASLVVCDRGYLRHQKAWRRNVAAGAGCEVVEVESDAIVPVESASVKAEYAARTIRPKLHRTVDEYLVELTPTPLAHGSLDLQVEALDLADLDAVLARLALDRSVSPVPLFQGGAAQARRLLRRFVRDELPGYTTHRNRPETDSVSHMSKYLHFGQISPIAVALAIRQAAAPAEAREAYLEELLVRRELALNFVHFTERYDDLSCLPSWARATLEKHRSDPRPHCYSPAQLENAETHDPYWNAAMREMRYTGYMHNYMRMYWGKKILEWSESPEAAFRTALTLNNTYFLDGRDPVSYAGVAWVFGLHDRPWTERPILGTLRWMSAGGLERKADPEAYVAKVDRLVASLQSGASRET